MSAVETPPRRRLDDRAARVRRARPSRPAPEPAGERHGNGRRGWALAVGALVLVAFGLRVWGIDHGLPYAYNSDENAHFMTRAIGMFGHGLDPDYFVNPPAYTYVVHLVFAAVYGSREAVADAFTTDPTELWVLARLVSAVLGTLAVWMVYLAGARLMDRRVGLLAAGILTVAFLPVFYAHLALNDGVTLAPLGLALWGAAGVLRHGRTRDYAIAGIGLGLACATKYTGGIVLVPIVAAAGAQFAAPGGRRSALLGLGLAGLCSVAAFVVANPYAVLDFDQFWEALQHQSDASGDAAGKLGLTQDSGLLYYLWVFGWGFGIVPLAFASGGAVRLWRDERRLVWVLVPAVVLFMLFMGTQSRYFGRWLIPIFPFMAILAAYGGIELADWLGRRRPRLRPSLLALVVVALCGQGAVYALHNGLVLSRDDTRNMVRAWLVDNVRVGARIVVEPVAPNQWAQDIGKPAVVTSSGDRWTKYPTSRSYLDPKTGRPVAPPGVLVNIEDYERTLHPGLIDRYERDGFCWVVTGFTQRGRAEAEPAAVPQAVAYYRELESRATVAYEASPYVRGADPVAFNFDWTFDYYPLAYHRPGPLMTVYRLHGGACAP